jgi:hypothetical protein
MGARFKATWPKPPFRRNNAEKVQLVSCHPETTRFERRVQYGHDARREIITPPPAQALKPRR